MNEIKKGTIIGYISIILNALILFGLTPILINKLGTSDYGLYTLISSVMAYFNVLDLGLGATAVRYISKNYKDKEKMYIINGFLFKIYLIISIVALILGCILYINADKVFLSLTALELIKFKKSLVIMVITLAITFPLSVCSSYIMAHEKFVFQKIISLLQNIFKPLLMLPLLFLGYKSVGMVFVIALINLLIGLINYIYAKRKLQFKLIFKRIKDYKDLIKELFTYSFYILLIMIVDTVFNNTDQVILAAYSGTMAVSIYNAAMKFTSTNTNLSSIIAQMFFPKLTKMVSEKKPINEISKIFLSVSRIQLFILGLILSGFLIFGKQFMILWVGKEFISSYYIVLIILIPSLIPLSQNIGIYVLQAMNKHKFRSLMFFGIAILNIIITIPLSTKYGGMGAAIGSAIAILLGQIITMNIYYSKVIKLDIKGYWEEFIKIIIPITFISIILKIILNNYLNTWILLIISIIIYVSIYFIYLYYILFNENEKKEVNNMIKKIKEKLKNFLKKIRDYILYRNFITEYIIPVKNRVILESKPDFSDNTYSLYLEMLKNNYQDKYEIIWLVTSDNIPDNRKVDKVKYFNINKKGIIHFIKFQYLLNTARFIITCNRVFKRKTKRQVIIYLDHGTPLKDLSKLKINYSHVDASLILGEFFINESSRTLNIDKNKFFPLGFPRNDGLFEKKDIKTIFKIDSEKVILWLPTFRKYEDNKRVDSTFNMPLGIPIVYDEDALDRLNKKLKKNKVMLIIKPHFAASINNYNMDKYSNIRIMTNKDLDDKNITLYEFLGNCSALITDYSSVYYDYLITKKPIGLTLDDFLDYKNNTGFLYEYKDVFKGEYIYNIEELLKFIDNIGNDINNSYEEINKIIKKFGIDTEGNYSKKVFDYISNKFNF